MITYRATLDLSSRTLRVVRDLISADRRRRGGKNYRLSAGRQAILTLVHLRKNETFTQLAAAFAISTSTAWRYVHHVVRLLTQQGRRCLHKALATADTPSHLIIDGTCIPIDRVADRSYWCGKHRRYEVNIAALIHPDGEAIWTSPGLPGITHDLTAARAHGMLDILAEHDVLTLGDKGYQGAGWAIHTPYKGKNLSEVQREANRALNRLRAPGERAFAQLKTWKILRRYRGCPTRVGDIVTAVWLLDQHR